MNLVDKSITCLFAHPDDEIIFGFGILPYTKKIICCSNDINNKSRPNWKNRHLAIKEVGKLFNIEIICLDYNSDFYRQSPKGMTEFVNNIKSLIHEEQVLFTHNFWGEYGHPDHCLIHNIAKENKKELIVSDIMIRSHYFNSIPFEKPIITDYLEVTNDLLLYKKCKSIYNKYHSWTWVNSPIKKAKLYIEK
jgi:hypothetical protein